jgi:hypothetical protein
MEIEVTPTPEPSSEPESDIVEREDELLSE